MRTQVATETGSKCWCGIV